MSRFARRVDANHNHVVSVLRQVGAWVWSTAHVGGGFPDMLVWYRGRFTLLEVKDGAKVASARKLTDAEAAFIDACPGRVFIVTCPEEAIAAVTLDLPTFNGNARQIAANGPPRDADAEPKDVPARKRTKANQEVA